VLNGLHGRKSGSVAGYDCSDANKGLGNTWSEASFLDYIKDPKAKIPNTKMTFAGTKNEVLSSSSTAMLDREGLPCSTGLKALQIRT
jgi:cytochrome c